MLELTLIGISAAFFALGIWLLVRLADGAPPPERRIWLLFALAAVVGLAARVVMGYRTFGHGMDAPLGLQLTLITNPLTVSIVLAFITPILRTYRVAEARRQAAEAAFRRSLDDARDAIAIMDRDMVITYANSAACALVQRPGGAGGGTARAGVRRRALGGAGAGALCVRGADRADRARDCAPTARSSRRSATSSRWATAACWWSPAT